MVVVADIYAERFERPHVAEVFVRGTRASLLAMAILALFLLPSRATRHLLGSDSEIRFKNLILSKKNRQNRKGAFLLQAIFS